MFAVILTAVILPFTSKPVSVPTDVMFGCAASTIVFAVDACVAFATVPVTLAPTTFDNPPASPVNTPVFAVILTAVILPFTSNPVNVPTLVMFG